MKKVSALFPTVHCAHQAILTTSALCRALRLATTRLGIPASPHYWIRFFYRRQKGNPSRQYNFVSYQFHYHSIFLFCWPRQKMFGSLHFTVLTQYLRFFYIFEGKYINTGRIIFFLFRLPLRLAFIFKTTLVYLYCH